VTARAASRGSSRPRGGVRRHRVGARRPVGVLPGAAEPSVFNNRVMAAKLGEQLHGLRPHPAYVLEELW
jgi:hypothetical protein